MEISMKRFFFGALLIAGIFVTSQAFAMDLAQARSSGAVGEKLDGYVAVVKSSPDAQTLVSDVNARRKAEYARISGENKQPADIVAKLAAEQIIKNLPAGSLYQGADGSWVKK